MLAGPAAQELSLMLRQLLLPIPEYCQEASTAKYSGLMALHMTHLNSRALDGSEATFRTANTLLQLFSGYPSADMDQAFQADLVQEFQHVMHRLHSLR